MKKFIATAFVIALFSIFGAKAQVLEIVGGHVYDWGTVKPTDSPLKTKITIKNIDKNGVLEISRVKTSCGCTTAPLSKRRLTPLETAEIDITLNLGSRRGQVSKSVSIHSNDIEKPVRTVILKAEVVADLYCFPTSYFVFSDMKVGAESAAEIRFKNSSKQVVQLTDFKVEPEDMFVNIRSEISLAPGDEIVFKAKVTPRKTGYFDGKIEFRTSHPDFPVFKIPAYGNVKESPLFNVFPK